MALLQDYNRLFEQNSEVKKIIVNGNVVWPIGPNYTVPLTFEMLSGGSISISNSQQLTIKYQVNNGSVVSSSSTTISINDLSSGDKVKFYGNNNTYGTSSASTCTKITSQYPHNIYGNIMSLISETGFENITEFTSNYNFSSLFNGNTGLKNAKYLLLPVLTLTTTGTYSSMFQGCVSLLTPPEFPATTLSGSCYASCFRECRNLTYAPTLPATTVKNSSYSRMFYNCYRLTEAPALPATTLAVSSYQYMFYGCSNITTAPDLLATDLYGTSYRQMFYGCSKLNYIKCLAENNITTSSSVNRWVSGVASTGTFVKKAGVSWTSGASGIPSGWTVVEV